MDSNRPKVSGLVTCFNEEYNIGACIESLDWCDEIVVVDSFSSDRTPEIAQSYDKVRFFQREYFGAGAQKNWAMQHVSYDWIFLLDSDERCTPELKDEVLELLHNGPTHLAYMMNRTVFLLGRQIKYSGWQRDRVSRFFKTGTAYYENRRVHSVLHTSGKTGSGAMLAGQQTRNCLRHCRETHVAVLQNLHNPARHIGRQPRAHFLPASGLWNVHEVCDFVGLANQRSPRYRAGSPEFRR